MFETTALYYDKYGRVVQSRATNHLLGYDLVYNELKFTGAPARTYKTHGINGASATITELYTYDYDKAQRLTTTKYSLNGGSLVTLASNTYDELGRLSTKTLGGIDATTYNYNIRSWTTDIVGSHFSENLYYNVNAANVPVFTPCYNGNIAGMQWTVASENLNYTRTYNFVYDELNRFTSSIYFRKMGSRFSNVGRYDEAFSYDKMGNVNSLLRYEASRLITDLSFAYTGNQLKKVDHNPGTPYIPYGSEAFNDKQKIDIEYNYDKNGSTTWDVNTGISLIQYNVLNLPDQIQFTEGHKNMYTYDASGRKLEAVNYTVHNIVNVPINTISTLPSNPSDYTKLTTDYVGNMIYENGVLKEILLPEGYYQGGVYYYYLKDHLGNNRLVINSSGAVIEKSHYYPSGMRFYPESTSNSAALSYRYNGKEMEAMNGLNQMDYGARRRGAGLPIWTAVDPLAEKYYSISPYAYCAGNPVRYVDIKGQWIKDVTGARVKVTYNENGSLSFSKNADVNTIRTANAINLTESGRSMLKFADNSSIGVRLKISSNTITSKDSDGKTHTTNGETLQGNNNKSDNFGRVVNKDGTYGIKEATITVYEGSLKEQIKEGSGSKLEGLTMDQAIGAVAGHEIVHATNKGEINKDIKAENSNSKRTNGEVKPNNVEQNIIDENKKPK